MEKQLAVVSRGQLLKLGMSDRAMQYRLRRGGPWQMLLPGVYLAASGIPSVSQKELAAMLYAGPGSIITGPMARPSRPSVRFTALDDPTTMKATNGR